MEDLLATQQQIIGGIEKLLTNFKKDGAERKTPTYIKNRLSSLESYWQEFQNNHIKLCKYDERNYDYFINDVYKQTEEYYINTRSYIMNQFPSDSKAAEKSLLRPATPLGVQQQSPSGLVVTPQTSSRSEIPTQQQAAFSGSREQGISSKLEEMFRNQKSNFKAFTRTVSSIDLENISEKWEFEDILQTIQNRWSAIDSLHWKIDSEVYEENIEYEQTFSKLEQKYQEIKKDVSRRMWSTSYREKSTPKMDVPTFTGNYHQWVSFKDLFVETVHNNKSMPNAQKLQFLKGKLKGEPERLIQHLTISSDNYQVCWDILSHRYNNAKLIFNSHVNILMSFPTIQHQSAMAIKKIHDTANECLNAIKTLGVDISTWDPLVVYIISNKLDADTHNDYVESLKSPRDLPSLQELLDFLESKFTSLESSKRKQDTGKSSHQQETSYQNIRKPFFKTFSSNTDTNNKTIKKLFQHNKTNFRSNLPMCPVCNKNHGIFHCNTFLELPPNMKLETVENCHCKNCLHNHKGNECLSNKKCRTCLGDHNTILHDTYKLFNLKPNEAIKGNKQISSQQEKGAYATQGESGEILLATAQVKVRAANGSYKVLRALIDQGSQASLVTENAAQLLGLQRQRCKGIVFGVGAKGNTCKGMLTINLSSIHSDYSISTDVIIMKNVINNLPNRSFEKPAWEHIEHIQLADPEYYISRPVDLLLGADIYAIILMGGIIKTNESLPIAQQTRFGWILCGNAANMKSLNCSVALLNDDEFQRFWSIEDVNDDSDMTFEDNQCLELYNSTTERREDGRYVVRLPMHTDVNNKLGHSKHTAVAQFFQLERKFKRQENIANNYKSFIQEYISLGHMHLTMNSNKIPSYYLPHHCVQRSDSTTTSLRVVFNASQSTSSGFSLNDLMFRGPNLQKDLLSLVISWRQYQYAFTADLEKMFRQILVHPDDQRYQRIIWRESAEMPLQDYQLATVTYGTKAAPFLAMRTLKQLASDERHRFPVASKVLDDQFYMDDLLSGGHNIHAAKQLQADLINLLKLGGFNLRKWISNTPTLLENICQNTCNPENFDFKHLESTKALGLIWIAKRDVFTFQCKMSEISESRPTKRNLLAEISKIFDPLGWLAPVTIKLKLLFQNVWIADLQWDDKVPDNIFAEWLKLRSDIDNINQLEIPRWIGSNGKDIIQIHGFSDASIKAYACVIYARIHRKDATSVILLAAKTRVVPISKTTSETSLPRLELCGALLLTRLMVKVKQSLSSHTLQIYGWCDSKAVLGWIQGDPNRWKPFVSNRIKKIIEIMPSDSWQYVKSSENPADCASRGLTASQLRDHSLWWQGPTWLVTYSNQNVRNQTTFETQLEAKKIKLSNVSQTDKHNIIQELLKKHSSFSRVSRVLAWILRAITRDRRKQAFLTVEELQSAKLKIIKYVQQIEFTEEIERLEQHNLVKPKSKIYSLNPFLDKDGYLRVGGRLKNANISKDMKHPLIIPHSSHLTDLLIDYAHKQTFHGGARLTLSWLRQQYWILGGNRAVKKRLHRCVPCKRHSPVKQQQIMGDLPESRTNPTRPFYHTGVDFTGFVDIKSNKGRGIKTTKGYVAVFVCMVTKAMHLELVSDLSSAAFLAALRRLAARRGTPKHIFSDNGTNFIGASRILEQEYFNLKSVLTKELLSEISEMQITWHFNAPSWPSAGGLWEAAVKSLKHHLRRVVGDQKLTYEEYATLLSQLEACLNTRPLCAITEDPNDINYLTPSHFLSSGPILTITETERDQRTRWQLTQKIFNDVWVRWRTEYLAGISARSKWRVSHPNIEINDIVIIHDGNLPPGKWALGRVVEVHPGKDGYVRVVSLKTKGGIIKRPIVKLSILPVNESSNQSNQQQYKPETAVRKEESQKTFKTSCVNFVSLIFMLFMLFVSPPVHGAYNISALQNNNSIYFDKLSDMHLIQDKWKIVVYYNMEPYWQGIKILKSYYDYLSDLCVTIQKQSHCDVILIQLHHGIVELEYYDTMLQSQHFDKSARARRGLIDGVGYIANSLFGVLDERFAEQYQRDITMIRTNQKHIAQYWKNQTSVIEAENNVLKRVESTMEKQHKIFNQHLIRLEQATSQLKIEIRFAEKVNEFMATSIMANSMLMNLMNIQDSLLDTITNAQHFNVHLLTPTQLKDELSIISSQLSKELSLPIHNIQTDLPQIYKILKVKGRMTTKYFIFEFQIPLINRDSYDIYKTITIPRRNGENCMIHVIPVESYLAMNILKDTYMAISENDLQKCLQIDSYTKLCELQKPVLQKKTDLDFCIKDTHLKVCQTISSVCQNTWITLFPINTFMFTCCGQCTLRIICGHQIASEQLNGVSIIALGSDCVIKGDGFTVTSHKTQTNQINIQPDVVTAEISPVNYLINISIPISEFNESNSFSGTFKGIDEQIEQMKTATEQLKEDNDGLSFHDIHHYAAIYVVIAIGLALFTLAWRRARGRTARAGAAPPANRSRQQISSTSDISIQSESVKAEPSEVQCSSAVKKESKIDVTSTASSPIFTKCSFRKIDLE